MRSFLQHVQAKDVNTICDVDVGVENVATMLMAFEVDAERRGEGLSGVIGGNTELPTDGHR